MGFVELDAGIGQHRDERIALLDLDDLLDRTVRLRIVGRRRRGVAVELSRRQQEVLLRQVLIEIAGGGNLVAEAEARTAGGAGAERGGKAQEGEAEGGSDHVARKCSIGGGDPGFLLQPTSPLVNRARMTHEKPSALLPPTESLLRRPSKSPVADLLAAQNDRVGGAKSTLNPQAKSMGCLDLGVLRRRLSSIRHKSFDNPAERNI